MTWEEQAKAHRKLHDNPLFYSLTPELAIATMRAINDCGGGKLGYYEFGLFKGFNIWFAEQVSRPHQALWQCYGFDSFEGMPANDVHPHWAEGNYAASLEEVTGHLRAHGAMRIHLYKGWFSTEYFASLRGEFFPVGVAVIDGDLYESCVPVLEFLGPKLIYGSILLFDDWKAYDNDPEHGEQKAWAEFSKREGVEIEELWDFGIYGKAFRVTKVGAKS